MPCEDGSEHGSDQGQLVVVLGLATAFVAATSAFAQLECGANRIYGTDRDRPALRKYVRAALLTLTAGSALALGLLLIVAGEPFGDAVEQVYHWGDAAESVGLYVVSAGNFGDTSGPLTAVMALLLWANVTGVALLAGVALGRSSKRCARAGRTRC